MIKKVLFIIIPVLLLSIFTSCNCNSEDNDNNNDSPSGNGSTIINNTDGISNDELNTLMNDTSKNIEYDNSNLVVTKEKGTECYSIEGNTIYFNEVTATTEYSISGNFSGNIVINPGDDYKFTLNLCGLIINSSTTNPIKILTGDKVTISAKADYNNYIYDNRDKVLDTDTVNDKGAIYAECDLELKGRGILNVISKNNNGVHTKDNLEIANLTLNVISIDNAIKGNDKVEISAGTINCIAKEGDCIKTSNSSLSNKNKQKGDIIITGGTLNLYAATDGIDAAHDAILSEDDNSLNLNIYTDKYSDYSNNITYTSSTLYLKVSMSSSLKSSTKFCVKFYNSDDDYTLVNATYYTQAQNQQMNPRGSSNVSYIYKLQPVTGYSYYKILSYASNVTPTDDNYSKQSSGKSINNSYDQLNFTYSTNGFSSISFSSYSTASRQNQGGFGMMNEGNAEKNDYSSKGIKSDNAISISGGNIAIKSYDDAIHANSDNELESGATPLGNVSISGGILSIYSNDDAIHADGICSISAGTIYIVNCYEGIEGNTINVSGGFIQVVPKDDGFNSCATSGTGMTFTGGTVYVYASGDGLDSNSQTSSKGIEFNGANILVICNSNNNSSIDTETGYTYTSGCIVAIGGGMSLQESRNCTNFSSVGTYMQSKSLQKYITCSFGNTSLNASILNSISGVVVMLGSGTKSISSSSTTNNDFSSIYSIWN